MAQRRFFAKDGTEFMNDSRGDAERVAIMLTGRHGVNEQTYYRQKLVRKLPGMRSSHSEIVYHWHQRPWELG